jgi:hypothetical protein
MGNDKLTGKEALKATADLLRAETEEKEKAEQTELQETRTELELLKDNTALASMYQESSNVGSENLSGETPQLKVHSAGRSKNVLFDGNKPDDGAFFYKPSAQQYKEVNAHILTISRGFRAPALEEGKPDVWNQIMGGLIIDGNEFKPFLMYFTGTKLNNLWEFGKAAQKYTKAKPVSIPMFALTVKLTTESIPTNFADAWIVNFEIVKNLNGGPKLIMDETTFGYVKNHVEGLQDMIKAIIDSKEINKEPEAIEEVPQGEVVRTEDPRIIPEDKKEEVEDIDELPF